MSRIASGSSADRLRRALAGLVLLVLAATGCATSPTPPSPPPPAPTAAELLEQRFPNRARTVRSDDGRWLAGWLADYWLLEVDRRALQAGVDAQRKAGYSVEESLLAVLPGAGLWTHASYGSWRELESRLLADCPVIVQVRVGSGAARTRHFIAVTDVSDDRVRGTRSGGGEWTMERLAFLGAWAELRNWMMIAIPPHRATWPLRSPEYASLVRYHDANGELGRGDALAARAFELDPDNADLATSFGVRALNRGRPGEAERLFRAALAKDDRHVRAANNLAFLLASEDRALDEALALARRAVLLEPSNPRALHTQGHLLGKTGRWNDACVVLERAWERARELPVSARVEIGRTLAQAYVETGSPHLAEALWTELLALDPDARPAPESPRE
ncbi:MAG TPA: hypothetical protein PKE12_04690 [Kiritimatiellia bacterium]|nr:hypothetical protein [Kiritimatiellia bacterium]